MTTTPDDTDSRLCLYCKHWRGNDRHAIEQLTARCVALLPGDNSGLPQLTYADDTCDQFASARRKAA